MDALKEMELTDERALLNFQHEFFTSYARELAAGPHLGEDYINCLNNRIPKHDDETELSFHELYTLCVFTSVMLSEETKETGDDTILKNSRIFVQQKTLNKEKFGSPQLYGFILQSLVDIIYTPEDTDVITFITMGTPHKFYPLILIYNQFFQMKDYFYALSKRVHLLSHPYKPSNNLHGGHYSEPIEVLNHDSGHLTHFSETYSGFCGFLFPEPLESKMSYKCDMYQRVGQYFFDQLQREDIDEISKKKLKEVGFNLTRENYSRTEVNFPSDKTLKSDLRYLMDCLKIGLKTTFLPDCLETVEKFKSSLKASYITFLNLYYPNNMPAKMNKNLVKVTQATRPLTFNVTYNDYTVNNVCYDFYKRKNVDWVRSAQRVGFKGKVSEDNMEYNPKAAREFHINLLKWFEANYLSKI